MRRTICFFGAFLLILAALPVHAGVLHVEKWGQDSGYCGSANDPCNTIGQAIDNADPGDTIRVGPGVYGDADENGWLSGPGEEYRNCGGRISVVCVDRDNLKLESTMGAASTVIDAPSPAAAGVVIRGNGVKFGKKGRGFTIRHSTTGVVLNADRLTVQDIRAEDNTAYGFYGNQGAGQGHCVLIGNTAVRSHTGFYFRATGQGPYVTLFSQNRSRDNSSYGVELSLNGNVTIDRNVSVNNNSGFNLRAGGGTLVKNNLAVGNATDGLTMSRIGSGGGGISLIGNSASGNETKGFLLQNVDKFIGNVCTRNGIGMRCLGLKMQIKKNFIAGNRKYGMLLIRNGSGAAAVTVEKNNIFDNGWESGGNCGLNNQLATALTVRKNFWGDAGGPGADPADDTCGAPVTEASPAKKPVKVKVKTAGF